MDTFRADFFTTTVNILIWVVGWALTFNSKQIQNVNCWPTLEETCKLTIS